MKSILLMMLLIFSFASCSNKNQNDNVRNDLKDTLLYVDKEFSKLSENGNTADAFMSYCADDVILMREGGVPIVGGVSLKDYYLNRKNTAQLHWIPLKADVSGRLGYTFGRWELKWKTQSGNDTIAYGVYSTVWKRQDDGSWKFVLDGGNLTPTPFELAK